MTDGNDFDYSLCMPKCPPECRAPGKLNQTPSWKDGKNGAEEKGRNLEKRREGTGKGKGRRGREGKYSPFRLPDCRCADARVISPTKTDDSSLLASNATADRQATGAVRWPDRQTGRQWQLLLLWEL